MSSTLPAWQDRTIVFGGSFDPPHLGHRLAVEGIFRFPGAKKVIVLPSGTPPLKKTATLADDRLEMARANFEGLPNVEISTQEISGQKSAPSFTYDTLLRLKREVPNLAFAIGVDQIAQFHRWHRYRDLLGLCHWLVLQRKPVDHQGTLELLAQWEASGLARSKEVSQNHRVWSLLDGSTTLLLAPTQAPELSSTQIRERIAKEGAPPAESLSAEVMRVIESKKLYGL